jgi:hypothetical protein
MARLLTTGGEESNSLGDLTLTQWDNASSGITIVTSPVHTATGVHSILCPDNGAAQFLTRSLVSVKTTGSLWARIYAQWTTFGTSPNSFGSLLRWTNSGASAITIRFNPSTKKFRIDNAVNATTLDGTITSYAINKWYRIECEVDIAAAGNVIFKIFDGDSTTPIETLTQSGANTLPATGGYTSIEMGNRTPTTWGPLYLDDIAINDETTAAGDNQISWCGPGAIILVNPSSDSLVAWSRTGAASNAAAVDEVPGTPDDATTLVSTTSNSAFDQLNANDLSGSAPSSGYAVIDIYGRFSGTTTASGSFQWSFWVSGTRSDGPANHPTVSSSTWRKCTTQEHLSADISAYSRTNLNTLQLGYTATFGSGVTKQITAVWAQIEYIPGTAVSVSSSSQTPYVSLGRITRTHASPTEAKRGVAALGVGGYESTSKQVSMTKTSSYESLGTTAISKAVIHRYESLKKITQQF